MLYRRCSRRYPMLRCGFMLICRDTNSSGTAQKKMTIIASCLVGATYTAMMLMIIFWCFPVQKSWSILPNTESLSHCSRHFHQRYSNTNRLGITGCKYDLPHFYVLGPLNALYVSNLRILARNKTDN